MTPAEQPTSAAETESLTSAARRWGRSTTRVAAVLDAAGVYRRGRGNIGRGPLRLRVEDVDRAMRATGAAPRGPRLDARPSELEPPAVDAPAAPAADAHVPDADGNVGCETCWAIATLTRGRIIRCRWCRGSAAW